MRTTHRHGAPSTSDWRSLAIALSLAFACAATALAQDSGIDLLGVRSSERGGADAKGANGSGSGEAKLVFDAKQGKKPDLTQFRTMQDPFKKPGDPAPTREGLDALRASGSSQFSDKGLEQIMSSVNGSPLVIFDLREESHGLVNGQPVSWKGKMNAANLGKELDDIVDDEKQRLEELEKAKDVEVIREADDDGQQDEIVKVTVESTDTEKKLVKKAGAKYVRIPVTDHCHPEDRDVDRFLKAVKKLPEGAWLHFHCRAGKGRTTTFLAMYDMMKNARSVSVEEIVRRQAAIGGSDLFEEETDPAKLDTAAKRKQFVRRFHEYCRTNSPEFEVSWSEWTSAQSSEQSE